MALASSSSSTSELVYDVFLSFRGEDTRTNFADHLYKDLIRAGIRTFRDDDELERGEEIRTDLLKTIEKSRFSVIVFSRNYASSTWCLDELAQIMKCRKTRGQIVLPVFYDVEPSAVRKQKRSFEEAFAGHEDRFKEEKAKLDSWRMALKEAADLNGYDVKNKYESIIIDEIVKDISNKLHLKRLDVAANPVGIDSRAYKVKSLLYDESADVRIVGIYGIGGIGKTTIAKEVYNSIILEFEGSSFLANVRENSNPKDIVRLQNQLLSDILKGKHEEISNSDRGRKVIEERLCSIKVLVVFDDVDELKQINKILGNFHVWLSKGSRIIITTRIKGLLPSRVYRQHKLEELNEFESLQLFSINAFGEWHPLEEYLKCSKSFVHYCGGIPLALELLGSYLCGQSVDVWENKLEKLEEIPHADIQDVLEISCDSLDVKERDIFLDLACFFIGKDNDYIISILDGSGFYAIDGINTLIRRCLVQVEHSNMLAMHDLIRDMGRKIVFKECPKDCGKRSRVWHPEEAFNLLLDRKGTEAVEALSLNVPTSGKISTKAFRKMKNLRLLELNSTNLYGSYKYISKELQWLSWSGFPLKSIPTNLRLGNLVALDMPYNSLNKVWEEEKFLRKLKFLNLSHSHELKETPNFELLPNLEIVSFEDCPMLVEVHGSIGLLSKLVTLNLKDCINLENLPRSFCEQRSLKYLNASGCSKLGMLAKELGNMQSLVVIPANQTTRSRVPKTVVDSKSLSSCYLPVSLRTLKLSYCNLSDDMISYYLQNLFELEYLHLDGNCFSSLPSTISLFPKLVDLTLTECRGLKSIREFELPPNLNFLSAADCVDLERINLPRTLTYFNVFGCCNLVEIERYFKVEPVGVEIVKKLREDYGLSLEDSIANARVLIVNLATNTYRISPLQGFFDGIYSFFLPCSEIPRRCSHQSRDDSIFFNVPTLQGRKILGFIVCVVYARSKFHGHNPIHERLQITISNLIKKFKWDYNPTFFCFHEKAEEDIMWLSYWCFENSIKYNDRDFDPGLRFKNELEEGDELGVEIKNTNDDHKLLVKMWGVDLLYQENGLWIPKYEVSSP